MDASDLAKRDRRPLHPSARSSARLGLGEVDVIAPGLLHVRLAGSLQLEHIESMMIAVTQEIADGKRVIVAIDADDVHAYRSEVRKMFQGWLRDIQPEVEAVWILYRSPVVKMGISLMNAFTGGLIQGFNDHEAFDAALLEATRKAKASALRKANYKPGARL